MNDLIDISPAGRRRRHSPEFKAALIQACKQPGMSVAAVALQHQVNANLLRRWITAHTSLPDTKLTTAPASFVPLPLSAPSISAPVIPAQDIVIELRRGNALVTVRWPLSAAADCTVFLQRWLR